MFIGLIKLTFFYSESSLVYIISCACFCIIGTSLGKMSEDIYKKLSNKDDKQ